MTTNEEAINTLKDILEEVTENDDSVCYVTVDDVDTLKMAIKALEQTDKVEESNFSTEQYKADLQGAYDCGYNSGYADAMNDIAESEGEYETDS